MLISGKICCVPCAEFVREERFLALNSGRKAANNKGGNYGDIPGRSRMEPELLISLVLKQNPYI